MATWDFLFETQQRLGITGGMLEIGVFKGKSAILSALHMKRDEPAFFIGIFTMRKFAPGAFLTWP